MRVVESWTGGKADALRRAFRMTIEDFTEELGVSIRAVAYWRQRSDMVQKPERQAILDTVLERAPDSVKARFGILISEEFGSTAGGILGADRRAGTALISHVGNFGDASEADARSVLAWLESTNTSDDVINYFARTVAGAAEDHASTPPTALLSRVHQLHTMIRALLQNGRQRQRQTADLLTFGRRLTRTSMPATWRRTSRQGRCRLRQGVHRARV